MDIFMVIGVGFVLYLGLSNEAKHQGRNNKGRFTARRVRGIPRRRILFNDMGVKRYFWL